MLHQYMSVQGFVGATGTWSLWEDYSHVVAKYVFTYSLHLIWATFLTIYPFFLTFAFPLNLLPINTWMLLAFHDCSNIFFYDIHIRLFPSWFWFCVAKLCIIMCITHCFTSFNFCWILWELVTITSPCNSVSVLLLFFSLYTYLCCTYIVKSALQPLEKALYKSMYYYNCYHYLLWNCHQIVTKCW